MKLDSRNEPAVPSVIAATFALAAFAAGLLVAAQCSAQNVPSQPAEVQTYYMFVLSNPVAGREDEYNKWYNEQHAPDVVSIPGFVSAQRFMISDIQLAPSATAPNVPKYMVMFKIVTADLDSVYAEVKRRLANGMTKMSSSISSTGMSGFTYMATRPLKDGTLPKGIAAVKLDSLPAYVQLVFADPETGTESEYNQWYDQHHAPEILALPGFVSGQRFILSNVQLMPGTGKKYMTMFRIVSPDIAATIDEFKREAPKMTDSPAFKSSHTVGYTYKAIGPVIDGDRVRAERATK